MLLGKIRWDDYRNLRKYIYSDDSLRFDDPERPLPTEDEEKSWWRDSVDTGEHKMWSLVDAERVVGLVHAFSFEDGGTSCELGINIMDKHDYGKGFGKAGVELLVKEIEKLGIKSARAEINSLNAGALRIFEANGFRENGKREENGIRWLVLERKTGN